MTLEPSCLSLATRWKPSLTRLEAFTLPLWSKWFSKIIYLQPLNNCYLYESISFNKSFFCACVFFFFLKPIWTVPLTICVCFPDVVNLNLKSTLRVLYNLFTNYKNSDWTLTTSTFISAEATLCWPYPPLDTAGDHLGRESLHHIAFSKKTHEAWSNNRSGYSEMSNNLFIPF